MKILLVLLVASAVTGFFQQRQIRAVRMEIASRKKSLDEADRLRTNNDHNTIPRLNAEQIAAMRADRRELMRLRASQPDLRAAARSPEEMAAEIAKIRKAAAREEENARVLRTTHESGQHAKAARGILQKISMLIQTAQRGSGETMARSFQELEPLVDSTDLPPGLNMIIQGAQPGATAIRSFQDLTRVMDSTDLPPGVRRLWETLSRGEPPLNITLDHFEFVPEAASKGGSILMREGQPRQLADGTWTRLYLLSNFQIEESRSPERDFAAWEI